MLSFLSLNYPAILSILSMLLGVGVTVANLAKKKELAERLQQIEDALTSVIKSGPSDRPPAL